MKHYLPLLIAAFLGYAPASASAASSAALEAAKAHLNFVIRIPELLRLRTVQAQQMIEVAEGSRVVEVAEAATFDVQSNTRAYDLRFDLADPEVVAVEIEGLDRAVRLTREGASLRFGAIANAERTLRRTLRYRITLAAGARPGPRPMPVVYSLQRGP